MTMRRSVALMAACGALIAASVAPFSAAASTPGLSPEASRAVGAAATEDHRTAEEFYSELTGVSLAEAKIAYHEQDRIQPIMARLRGLAGDRLIGAHLVHNPLGVKVTVTDGEPLPGLEELASGVGVPINVAYENGATFNERLKVMDHVAGALGKEPGVGGIYPSEDSGKIIVKLGADASVEAVSNVLQKLGHGPELFDFQQDDVRYSDELSGGLPMTNCTVGFSVQTSSTIKAVITAGHCPNAQSYGSLGSTPNTPLTFQAEARNANADVQWHTASVSAVARWWAQSTTTAVDVTDLVSRSEMPGTVVCHRGKTTGYSCGVVDSASYQPTYSGACSGVACAATWGFIESTSIECDGGDSGGPYGNGGRVYGIHKAGGHDESTGDCTSTIFMPIGYVSQNLGVSIRTT